MPAPKYGSRAPNGAPLKFLQDLVEHEGVECVIWPFSRRPDGYGQVGIGGLPKSASYLMCELAHGAAPIPKAEARHSCGKGHLGCVNPVHLRWGTHKDNMRDKAKHGTQQRGEACFNAKLTDATALAVYDDQRTYKDIANAFGVAIATVQRVKHGRGWAHVTGHKTQMENIHGA